MPWDPERYEQFQREREAPFTDLLQLIHVRAGMSVVDLGCGTGALTRRLADALPGSDVLGIDSSAEMLARAAEHARPGLRFERGDIADVNGEWDLVFSHAALQWVPNHRSLIPRLFGLVRSGGQLAAQIPAKYAHIALSDINQTAEEEPFRSALSGWIRDWPVVFGISEYAALLFDLGGRDLTVLKKVYPHVLKDADAVFDWTSGTALVPLFECLPQELHELFAVRYRTKLRERFPGSPVFYPFRRILMAASREL